MTAVSIVIVSHDAAADLERCLQSLHAPAPALPHEIVVVDNASTEGNVATARRFGRVRVIESGANVGFARATNIGIRAGRGEFVLLLNSDTVVPPGAVDRLVAELQRRPDAAVVGPRLVDASGRVELSFGRMLGPFNELRQKRLVDGHAAGRPTASRRVERLTSTARETDWVSGACLLVRRSDAEAVGLLDERYFLYIEDVDFCAAIRARGRRVWFTPAVQVVHARGRSAATAPEAARRAWRQSKIAFYEKHHPWLVGCLRLWMRLRGQGE